MMRLVRDAGLVGQVEVDSAGTSGYHKGDPPDSRARAAARRRGVELRGRARQFKRADWDRFDYVLAVDRTNFEDLEQTSPSPEALKKLRLLRTFDPSSQKDAGVPDPYFGGDDGFEEVLDICEAACRGLLEHVRREHGF